MTEKTPGAEGRKRGPGLLRSRGERRRGRLRRTRGSWEAGEVIGVFRGVLRLLG